jgi:hypothetical protein
MSARAQDRRDYLAGLVSGNGFPAGARREYKIKMPLEVRQRVYGICMANQAIETRSL